MRKMAKFRFSIYFYYFENCLDFSENGILFIKRRPFETESTESWYVQPPTYFFFAPNPSLQQWQNNTRTIAQTIVACSCVSLPLQVPMLWAVEAAGGAAAARHVRQPLPGQKSGADRWNREEASLGAAQERSRKRLREGGESRIQMRSKRVQSAQVLVVAAQNQPHTRLSAFE